MQDTTAKSGLPALAGPNGITSRTSPPPPIPKESRPPPTPPQRLTGPQRLRPRPPGARPKGRAPHQRRPTPRTRHSKDAWTNDPSRRPRIPSLSLRFQRTTAAPRAKLSSTTPTLGAPSLRSQISPRRSGERRAEALCRLTPGWIQAPSATGPPKTASPTAAISWAPSSRSPIWSHPAGAPHRARYLGWRPVGIKPFLRPDHGSRR
jgi:hypothetical protein